MEIICVPLIVSAVFSIIEGYKAGAKRHRLHKILLAVIPIIAASIGAVLGVVLFFAWPCAIAAADAFTAILVGAASGLSATGANQIFKQLQKLGVDIKPREDEPYGTDGRDV